MDENRIEVTVLWFAALRERRGAPTERVTTVDGNSVDNLLRELLGAEVPAVAYVVNRSRVAPSTALSAGDEVAFLPPLGGG